MQHIYRAFFCKQAVSLLVSLVCFVPCLRAETGYVCNEFKKYVSCAEGYYLSDCGSDPMKWLAPKELTQEDIAPGNSCAQCADGFKCVGGAACPVSTIVTCEAGEYLNIYVCETCITGYYCLGDTFDVDGNIQGLNPCPGGKYNPNTGSESDSECKTCEGGYYCGEAAAEQTPCGAGYFCPQGSEKQTECGVGYYCPEKSANHNSCPAGTTTSTATSTAKTECYISSATKFKDKNGEFVLPINYNIYVK